MSKIRRIILETAAEKMLELIKNALKGDRTHKGQYSMPYSSSDDDMVDYIINYRVSRVKLWKSDDPKCVFEGTIYVMIDRVLVGFEGTDDWEKARIHDLPSWTEDDFKDEIIDELKIFPVCVDVDYDTVK
jgi:hypothetical protein